MNIQFSDLHSDLLSYLAGGHERSVHHDESRTSTTQLIKGKVSEQTLAVFTVTGPNSVEEGLKQIEIYKMLPKKYPTYFQQAISKREAHIKLRLAIENISGLFLEDEPFDTGLSRLKKVVQEVEMPLYVSLTWNTENRFGGGNDVQSVGLKEDGKRLLEALQGLTFAIDLSHASDKLAEDIFNYTDQKQLKTKIIASHSNFRKIKGEERNLPDEIADEIVRRKGIIGLAFIKRFIGSRLEDFLQHVEYGIGRGYEEQLVIGADLFFDQVMPANFRTHDDGYFFEGLDNAACYQSLAKLLQKHFGSDLTERIAHKNFKHFLNSHHENHGFLLVALKSKRKCEV